MNDFSLEARKRYRYYSKRKMVFTFFSVLFFIAFLATLPFCKEIASALPKNVSPFMIFFGWIGSMVFSAFFSLLRDRDRVHCQEIEKKFDELSCQYCYTGEKIAPDVPFCKTCLDQGVEKVNALIQETKEKIIIAESLGLKKQADGNRALFEESLPPAVRWVVNQTILAGLKESFPQAAIFSPRNREFEKHALDTADPSVNIPLEGLRLLKEVHEKGLQLTT